MGRDMPLRVVGFLVFFFLFYTFETQHTIKRICTARYHIPYTRIVVGCSHNSSSSSIQRRWSLNLAKRFCWTNGIFLFVVPRVLHLYLNRIYPSTLPGRVGLVKVVFSLLFQAVRLSRVFVPAPAIKNLLLRSGIVRR